MSSKLRSQAELLPGGKILSHSSGNTSPAELPIGGDVVFRFFGDIVPQARLKLVKTFCLLL